MHSFLVAVSVALVLAQCIGCYSVPGVAQCVIGPFQPLCHPLANCRLSKLAKQRCRRCCQWHSLSTIARIHTFLALCQRYYSVRLHHGFIKFKQWTLERPEESAPEGRNGPVRPRRWWVYWYRIMSSHILRLTLTQPYTNFHTNPHAVSVFRSGDLLRRATSPHTSHTQSHGISTPDTDHVIS